MSTSTMCVTPPETIDELLQRAKALEGISLAEIALHCRLSMPTNLRREKGWVGQCLEKVLGATAGSEAQPDFPQFGIELKTLPLNRHRHPKESTFVNRIDLLRVSHESWETSLTKRKLSHVLWVAIEAENSIPLSARRICRAWLWEPSKAEEKVLSDDWMELTEMLGYGELEQISAKMGTYLQVRPKAASSRALCWGFDAEGARILTLPRGFYLRTHFTRLLFEKENFSSSSVLTPV